VRTYLAWKSVSHDIGQLDLTQQQAASVRRRVDETNKVVDQRIGTTWTWAIHPIQPDGSVPSSVSALKVEGDEQRLSVRVGRKLVKEDILRVAVAPASIEYDLKSRLQRVWNNGRISVGELWDYYTKYPYLPRLRSRSVLVTAIESALLDAGWAEEGFATFKLKLGAGDDVGQVRAVREAVGPVARIRVDANAAWDVETAKRTLAELEPLDVELAEQPVATLEETAEVAGATSIPIAGDESVESRADAERAVALGACGLAGVKLSKVGGPEAAIEIAEVLPSFVSSALDGPVGIAAAAQVAQTLCETAGADDPGLAHGLATQRLFASTIASTECELRDGMLHLPEGPGLGVEIDEAALDAHRL